MRAWMIFAASLIITAVLAGLIWRRYAPAGRWVPRVGLVIALAVAALSGYVAWREHRALDELAALIDPFPGIERAFYAPALGPDGSTWMFRTSASPQDVHRFYLDEDHRRGWTVRQDSGLHMVMHREGLTLDLSIQPDAPGQVLLLYAVTRRAPP